MDEEFEAELLSRIRTFLASDQTFDELKQFRRSFQRYYTSRTVASTAEIEQRLPTISLNNWLTGPYPDELMRATDEQLAPDRRLFFATVCELSWCTREIASDADRRQGWITLEEFIQRLVLDLQQYQRDFGVGR